MTRLPEKDLLDGTKNPETTTGEFRLAMGNIRQFLADLFGDESSDKETARQTLGIDLTRIKDDISAKADRQTVDAALDEKADKDALSLVAATGDYNHLVNKPVVYGMIVMWSGSASTVPEGWALCNGENGTPDLRDRFVVGAGKSYAAGDGGGNTSQTVSFTGNTGATTLTIAQMPSHSHGGYALVAAYEYLGNGYSDYQPGNIGYTGGNQPHSHSLSGTSTISTLPPYYALCYIMKV